MVQEINVDASQNCPVKFSYGLPLFIHLEVNKDFQH